MGISDGEALWEVSVTLDISRIVVMSGLRTSDLLLGWNAATEYIQRRMRKGPSFRVPAIMIMREDTVDREQKRAAALRARHWSRKNIIEREWPKAMVRVQKDKRAGIMAAKRETKLKGVQGWSF